MPEVGGYASLAPACIYRSSACELLGSHNHIDGTCCMHLGNDIDAFHLSYIPTFGPRYHCLRDAVQGVNDLVTNADVRIRGGILAYGAPQEPRV